MKQLCVVMLALTALLSGANRSLAQTSEDQINFYASAVQFPNPVFDTAVLVEFPFSLTRNEFEFFESETEPDVWEARVYSQVKLFNTNDKLIDSASTYFALKVASKADAEKADIRIFNKLQLYLRPGAYHARLTIVDVSSKKSGVFEIEPFVVSPIEKYKLNIGGLMLAYDIRYVGENKGRNYRMVKNGYLVYPSPLGVFSTTDTVMLLYAEVYNLRFDPESPGSFRTVYNVLNQDSSLFATLGSTVTEKADQSTVIVQSFDIRGWPNKLYQLQFIVSDEQSGQTDTAVAPFGIVKPISKDEVDMIRARLDDPYDHLTLKEKINLVEYLLPPQQKQTLNSLGDAGKLTFLDQYWKEADVDKSTKTIENRLEMIQRYIYCNERFSTKTDRSDGWLTARGRIYMTHGEPTEIDDYHSPRVGNPFQIWYYRFISEGKYFIFEDQTGYNDYRLVHSNVYGEIYDQNWQDFVDRGLQLEIE